MTARFQLRPKAMRRPLGETDGDWSGPERRISLFLPVPSALILWISESLTS
jgi:hypothetical protein